MKGYECSEATAHEICSLRSVTKTHVSVNQLEEKKDPDSTILTANILNYYDPSI